MRSVISSLLGALILAGCSKHPPEAAPTPVSATSPAAASGAPTASSPGSADAAARLEAERARVRAELLGILQRRIHFDFDQADLRSDDRALLDKKAGILLANVSVRIRIDGNADERGSDEYNLVLGEKRAVAAKQYLAAHGVDPSRIESISSGKERPLVTGDDEAAWARNRRDEFVVTGGADRLQSPPR